MAAAAVANYLVGPNGTGKHMRFETHTHTQASRLVHTQGSAAYPTGGVILACIPHHAYAVQAICYDGLPTVKARLCV